MPHADGGDRDWSMRCIWRYPDDVETIFGPSEMSDHDLLTGGRINHDDGRVAVVVLGFNDRRWLDRCLTSVLATTDGNFRVYFVDNASSDGSAEYVRATFPQVRVVVNASNLGFAGGNNAGLRVALGDGAEFAVLLNTDTWVEPSWLTELRAVFAADAAIGVVTAFIKTYDSDRIDHSFLQIPQTSQDFIEDAWSDAVRPWYETWTGSGAALMARRSFYESVGTIDPEFFMYYEEIDLLRRGRYHGHKVAFSTRGIIHHFNRLETPGPGSRARMLFERGFMIYTLKNQLDPLPKCVMKFLLEVVSLPVGALFRGEWRRLIMLLRVGAEILVKSPAII